ncbi:hypothetical protein [Pseudarthrobacter oxydans]|uniref:hypothetical protein n=1 Tax=Pseudarthrobacter oxydans TaxID=1671 RepID=UPI002AA88B25|nr:hypothetical protein [Pseudarthrobacter oxydans]WPU11077.1 hypothetical protein SMD14_08895 [Pseudarthrobacter oxydans]
MIGKLLSSKARKDGLLGIVNALTEYLSGTVVVIVLSFLAYMIGLLLAVEVKVLTTLVGKYGWTIDAIVKSGGKKKKTLVRIADIDDHERFLAQPVMHIEPDVLYVSGSASVHLRQGAR